MAQQQLKRYDDAPNSGQLAMRTQNFSVAFNDVNAQANTATDTATLLWRFIVIVCPALACLVFAIAVSAGRNNGNGVTLSNLCLLCLALVPLYWEMVAAAQWVNAHTPQNAVIAAHDIG